MRKLLFLPLLLLLLWQVPSYADSAQDAEYERDYEDYNAKDRKKSFKKWKPLAENGDAEAQYRLGNLYNSGEYLSDEGVSRDDEKALEWYRKAARQGHDGAQLTLGSIYLSGFYSTNGGYRNLPKAVKLYRKIAEEGDVEIQYKLIEILGQSDEIDYSTGDFYENSEGMAEWARDIAVQGESYAQYILGLMYYNGRGIIQNYSQAYMWLILAKENWVYEDYFFINKAIMEVEEELVVIDHEEGIIEFENRFTDNEVKEIKARAKQCLESNYKDCRLWSVRSNQSSEYEKGEEAYDVKSYKEAFKTYKPLAENGHTLSQHRLGDMYRKGESISQDYKEAMKWYRKAAVQGYHGSQHYLGQMYEEGLGVSKNLIDAYIWYYVSRMNGSYAKDFYRDIQEYLTDSEIEQVQAKARRCLESNYKDCH